LWFDSALLLRYKWQRARFIQDLDYAKKTKSYYFSNNIVFYRQRNKTSITGLQPYEKFEEIIREFIPNVTKQHPTKSRIAIPTI
jgi:ASC-1-like (ASCH) protein